MHKGDVTSHGLFFCRRAGIRTACLFRTDGEPQKDRKSGRRSMSLPGAGELGAHAGGEKNKKIKKVLAKA